MVAKTVYEDQVIRVIRGQLCVDNVEAHMSLTDDLEADSLDLLELGMAIEDAFDIEVGDSDVAKFNIVQDIITFVEQRK